MQKRMLRWLGLTMGVACVAIAIMHFTLGNASVPGERHAGATVDSRERFYAAIFLGYGLAWIWAVRDQLRVQVVRWLSVVFLLGGIGRLLSLAVAGNPQWFQSGLTAVEVVVPPVFLWLARGVSTEPSNPAGRR